MMSLRFFLLLLFQLSVSGILAINNEDPTDKTMEDFSGYPIHAPIDYSFAAPNTLLSFLSVDSTALENQIDELSTFSDTPAPSVTRILYTEKDVLARRYVKNLMGLSGLSVREDAVGNIFGRWDGYEPDLAPVATGSHIDAIPYSGKYDGVVGVLGAIEAINVLKRSGFKPKRSLEVVLFTSEEPTRFGIGCLGSRLLAGSKALAEALKTTVDAQNISFLEAARSAGYEGSYSAFLELHIEQGPILEAEGISIGIVTAIAAPASLKVDFEGNGGHAGAVLMPNSCRVSTRCEKHVLGSGSIDTVGTVGILELHPGAINSIPSKSHVEIDTRDIDEKRRNDVIEKIHQSATTIASKRGVRLSEFKIVNQDPPALSDKSVIEAMEATLKELNLTHKLMISRAYHDSLFMARVSPMGMLFIPCYKGYSHKPEEYASSHNIGNGVKVLALTLAKLSLNQ
ncbi:N-carbamyl-L-amino acid hydrolase family protein [Salix suchowensis]|nr:N-carbamyl-L-amino acid hydrolase family protein [Salix suchowensis]